MDRDAKHAYSSEVVTAKLDWPSNERLAKKIFYGELLLWFLLAVRIYTLVQLLC